MGHVDLQALVSSLLPGSLDQTSLMFEPLASVGVLMGEEYEGTTIPVLLAHECAYWLNTYKPTDECWEKLFKEVFDLHLEKGVTFHSYSHAVTRDGIASATETVSTTIRQEQLPLNRIRLVAPPELDRPLAHTLPLGYEQMKLRVIAGQRAQITYPDANSDPPTITLQPGEVVELTAE